MIISLEVVARLLMSLRRLTPDWQLFRGEDKDSRKYRSKYGDP